VGYDLEFKPDAGIKVQPDTGLTEEFVLALQADRF